MKPSATPPLKTNPDDEDMVEQAIPAPAFHHRIRSEQRSFH